MLYAWGMPLLIVSICLIVEFAFDINFGYEDYPEAPDICWISQPTSNLVAFGVPLAVIFIVNGVFFTLTIIKLNKVSAQMKDHKSTVRKKTSQNQQ